MTTTSTARRIAQDIIVRIQSGELVPGHHLREQRLAEQYQTSRGPVREALQGLAAEHWVTLERGKGARVVETSTDVDRDVIWISARLNGLVSRLAAARATAEDMTEIGRRVDEIVTAAMDDTTTPEDFGKLTWGLGVYLGQVARSRSLEEHLRPVAKSGLVRLARNGILTPVRRRAVARRWVDLAIALRNRDGDLAESLHRGIIETSLRAAERVSVSAALWQEDD